MSEIINRPARLDIVDLPRDEKRVLGALRQQLCASYNYCRKYPAKMAVLEVTLKAVLTAITAYNKYQKDHAEAVQKAADKAKAEADAIAKAKEEEAAAEELERQAAAKQAEADRIAALTPEEAQAELDALKERATPLKEAIAAASGGDK